MPKLMAVLVVLVSCAGCASASPVPTARELPSDAGQRDRALATFWQQLWRGCQGSSSGLANDRARDSLLEPAAARRPGRALSAKVVPETAMAPSDRALWGSAQYSGFCIQSGRTERPNGVVGLRRPGFVFERGLLIGREPGGGELAGWVEGVFLLTDAGFVALEIERIEPPRRDHSDLELAECASGSPKPPQEWCPTCPRPTSQAFRVAPTQSRVLPKPSNAAFLAAILLCSEQRPAAALALPKTDHR